MLALASALWLRDKQIACGKVAGVLLWYGLYGLRDSISRRLMGGEWDGLTRDDLQMYEDAYLRSVDDRESPYYCLFNNDLTRDVPPCFIASAEFDPLIDDSRLLFQTLQAHRQPCQYKMYLGTLHAFLHYSRMMKTADDALRDGARFFRAQL
jgi:acetyl esterase